LAVYRIEISEGVRNLLEHLSEKDKGRCKALVLLLLRLKKDHRPQDSRRLHPVGKPIPGSRVWKYSGFEITYQISDKEKVIFVGDVDLQES